MDDCSVLPARLVAMCYQDERDHRHTGWTELHPIAGGCWMSPTGYDREPAGQHELPMPTLMRAGPYRIFIFMFDCVEPVHVHVEGNDGIAKFWLRPVSVADSVGYSAREISRIRAIVVRERITLIDRFEDSCQRARR